MTGKIIIQKASLINNFSFPSPVGIPDGVRTSSPDQAQGNLWEKGEILFQYHMDFIVIYI